MSPFPERVGFGSSKKNTNKTQWLQAFQKKGDNIAVAQLRRK